MQADDELAQTFSNICMLFELSLATGRSLDVRACCDLFVGTLMARKGLGHGAVWLRGSALPAATTEAAGADELVLAYGVPRAHVGAERASARAPRFMRGARGRFSETTRDLSVTMTATGGTAGGAYCLFPLGEIGFLELHSGARAQPWSDLELDQLDTVVQKFAVSLEGCLAHERLIREIAERTRIEREQEEMRARLATAERMEAVGRLAGGVAHDFNNLLTPILGAAEILRTAVVGEPHLRDCADSIILATRRAADLTSQLLTFSRRGKLRLVPVDLDGLVQEVVALLTRTLDPRVRIVTRLGIGGAGVVTGDPARLQSVLLNLAVNACDAMESGGVLTIASEVVAGSGPSCARLVVSDTGVGMDAEVRKRVFEPFFTTKAQGKGTGLGLAAVYGAVQSHGGSIEVESSPGLGTTFFITLPLDHAPADAPAQDGALLRGRGRVLVVDDQAPVRTALCHMLTGLGYEALAVADGAAALAILDARPRDVDLVLLDIRMPDMSGEEVLRRIRARGDHIPVVIASGFGGEDELTRIRRAGVEGMLEKPFSTAEMSQVVSAALARRPP